PDGSEGIDAAGSIPAAACAPWVATGNLRGRRATAASSVNRGQDNDRDDVDDGAHSAPEGSHACRVFVQTVPLRTRVEQECRYWEDEPTGAVALQERNPRSVAQNCDTAEKSAGVVGKTADCLRKAIQRECESLLSPRTSTVALPLAYG